MSALLLLVLGAHIILHSSGFRSFVLKRANQYLQNSYGLTLEVESLRYNLWRLRLSARGIRIQSNGENEIPLEDVSIDSLEISITPSILFGGTPHVRRLFISNPRITAGLPAGVSGADAPPPDSPGPAPLSFRIDDLRMDGGRLTLKGREAAFGFDLTKIALSVSHPGPGFRHRIFLESGEGEISAADFSSQVQGLSCLLFFDMRSADIERLLLKTDVATLEVKGRVEDLFFSPHFDLNVDGAVHLAELSDFLDPKKSSEGDVRIKGTIESREDLPGFRGQISGDHLKIRGVPLDKIDALFSVDSASAELEKLELLFAGGRLTVEGKTPLPVGGGARFFLQWKDLDIAELMRMSGSDSLPVSGRSDGTLQAELLGSDLKSLTGQGEIIFQKTPNQTKESLLGRLRFTRKEEGIRLLPSRLHWMEMDCSASGFLSKGGDLGGTFEVVIKDLSGLPDSLQAFFPGFKENVPLEKVSGGLVLSGKIGGTDKAPRASVELSGRGLSAEGLDVPSLDIRAEINSGRLTVSRFEAVLLEGRLEGNGWIPFNPTDFSFGRQGQLSVEMRDLDLAALRRFLPSMTLEGLVSAKLNASGTLENPCVDYDFRLNGGRFDEYAVDAAGLSGRFEDGVLAVKEIFLSSGENRVEGWLEAGLKKGGLIQGGITTESFHLEPWLDLGTAGNPVVLSAQIGLAGRFSGEKAIGADSVDLDFNIKTLELRSGEWALSASESPVIGLRAGRLEVDNLLFTAPGTTLRFNGYFPVRPGSDGSLQAGVSADLKALGSLLPEAVFQGNLRLDASLTGPLERPSFNGSIELEGGRFEYPEFPASVNNGRLHAEFSDNILVLKKLEADIASGTLSAAGRWNFDSFIRPNSPTGGEESGSNGLNVALRGFPLEILSKYLPAEMGESLSGVLDTEFHLGGDASSLRSLHGEGVIERLNLTLSGYTVNNPERIDVRLRGGVLEMENFRLEGEGVGLGIKGRMTLLENMEMEGEVSASFDLASLSPGIDTADFGGMLNLTLSAKGPLPLPQITGVLTIEEGFFQSDAFMLLGTDFKGDIRFTGEKLEIHSIDGLFNGGSVNLSGTVLYPDLTFDQADIRLKADQIQLMYPDGFIALAGGSLLFKSRSGSAALSGNIKLDHAFYTENIYPGSQIWAGLKRRPVSSLSDIPLFLRGLLLNVSVTTGSDPLIIDNNLADLEIDADIRVNGTPVEPLFSGFIRNRTEGSVSFGNRSYEVESLVLSFDRSLIPDTMVSLKARTSMKHDYDNLDVILSLDGSLTNLNLSLSSSPPRSDTELASLLITGYGTERLQSDTANVLSDQLLLYFASPLASPLTNRIKNLLGAEEVTLEPINIATEEDPGARFTFRKGLAKNIDLVYSIDIGNTQEKTWLLNYDLNRNFSLAAFHRDNGEFGGSLSHRFNPLEIFKKKKGTSAGRLKRTVASLTFLGDSPLPESQLRKKAAGIKEGSVFDYGELRRAADSLTWELKKSRHPAAIVHSAVKDLPDGRVAISLDIRSGEAADVRFEGDPFPESWKRAVVREWNGRLPIRVGMTAARRRILTRLKKRGFYEAEVSAEASDDPGSRVYVFRIHKGAKYSIGRIRVDGATGLSSARVKSILKGIPGSSGHPG
ncbi:MAG: translocation/assembly module TamB domain-containing protein, partial [Acidobacteria bacterium]|nr:translocation/assembly module TamB domain-containing protein [Acidobacteriota bacterium]